MNKLSYIAYAGSYYICMHLISLNLIHSHYFLYHIAKLTLGADYHYML